MSDTVAIPGAEVADYVAAVRAALADLPADEVDDLTQGMEADLAEVLGEGAGGLTERLGTPLAYAAELRTAAGLPLVVPAAREARSLGGRVAGWRAWWHAWTERHPTLVDAARQLRPIWWLVRGVAVGDFLMRWVLMSLGLWLVVLVTVGSVWLGLRRSRAGRGEHRLGLVLDIGGLVWTPVLALAFVVGAGWWSTQTAYSVEEVPPSSGLWYNGSQVENIYAYGPDGRRLNDVRLFDSMGNPVAASPTSIDGSEVRWLDAAGRSWLTYPNAMSMNRGWTVNEDGVWHPPMSIDPLVEPVGPDAVTVDPLDNDTSAPTQASPTSTVPPTSPPTPTSSEPTTSTERPTATRTP